MFDVETSGTTATLRPRGDLRIPEAGELYGVLSKFARRSTRGGVEHIVLDFSEVGAIDSSVIATVSLMADQLERRGRSLHVENETEKHREALALMPEKADRQFGGRERVEGAIESLGGFVFDGWHGLAAYFSFCAGLFADAARAVVRRSARPPSGSVVHQAVQIGVDALPIVGLSSMLMGLVMGFQGVAQMRAFGAVEYTADLVGISMTREFATLMTSIIVAGRSGSAIAAEIGTMKVQEEIDALRVMGLDPQRYLALPRMIAILLVLPALSVLSMAIGVFGGWLIGVSYAGMTASFYLHRTFEAVLPNDVWHGFWKSFVFAFLIGSIACFRGFRIQGGASGVGAETTRSVVTSIFMLLVADSIASIVSAFSGGWL